MRPSLRERFESYVMPEPTTGCWIWIGAGMRQGYGVIGVGPHSIETTHRVSWQLYRGEIPSGLWILHKCDTRRCVNPDHLYLGTVVENTRDVRKRGNTAHWNIQEKLTLESRQRQIAHLPRGAKHHRSAAKLTESQVQKILQTEGLQREIAAKFGVCQQLISLIKRRKYWKHLS